MKKHLVKILILSTLISCEKENIVIKEESQYDVSEMLSVLEKSGIDTSLIEIKNSSFLVDGDISISFESIPEIKKSIEQRDSSSSLKAYHYPNPYYATEAAVSHIKIYANPSVSTNGWLVAVNDAISAWNSLNCEIGMTLVSSSIGADIKISTYFEDSNDVATGEICVNGKVGRNISINTRHNGISASIKKNTIAHELGHTIGFAHSDNTCNFCTPLLITGTNGADNSNAVMYKYAHNWFGFSADEVLGAKNLFRPMTLNGQTDLTNTQPKMSYIYTVNFGSNPSGICNWTIRYTSGGYQNTLPGTGSNIILYVKYDSSLKDGKNEVNYLEVYCPTLSEYAWIAINIKDGYRLYPSTGPTL